VTAVAAVGVAAGLSATSGLSVAGSTNMAAAASRAQARGARLHSATRQTGEAGSQLQTLVETTKPYEFYDSVMPSAIPPHQIAAVYATGPYAASPSEVAGRRTVMWIDVTGSDTAASALDTEPTDATPQQAATWAWNRLHKYPHALARIYTMISEWPQVQSLVSGYPANIRDRIRWWIADPTGVPHMVPGADATQWYWGSDYDISTANPGF
jgi:hypothetical protein